MPCLSCSEHSEKLVEQALLVSQELIRVAILWHEMVNAVVVVVGSMFGRTCCVSRVSYSL